MANGLADEIRRQGLFQFNLLVSVSLARRDAHRVLSCVSTSLKVII
jgi:hypothetical protein